MVQGRRPRIGPGRGGLTPDPGPTQAYPRPSSRTVSAALGVAWVGAASGSDRWRRVTMATRGVRRGPTPPPPPGVTHLRASPEKRRRRKRQGGRRPGLRSGRLRAGRRGSARAAVWAWRRSPRASVHQPVSQSFLPPAPPRSAAAQPSLLQTAVVKRSPSELQPRAQPIAALLQGASGPRRAGRPRRCLRGKESRLGGPKAGKVRTRLNGPAPGPDSKDQLDLEKKPAQRLRETCSRTQILCPL